MKKVFCERCRDTVLYTVNVINKEKEIDGKSIKFKGREAYCDQCRSEVFVPEIRDHNLSELEYAHSQHIIKECECLEE